MLAKTISAEGDPASPVARSSISSPERSEASEGEKLSLEELDAPGGADPLTGEDAPVLDAIADAVAVVPRDHGPCPCVERECQDDDERPEEHGVAGSEVA